MIPVILFVLQFAAVGLLVVVTIKQKRPPSRKSRGHQPLEPVHAHKALPFLDFSPAAANFTCISPNATTGKRCRNLICQKTTRAWANTVRNTVADSSPHIELVRDMLREYAELCLCKRMHRSKTAQEVIESWVQQWLEEIRALHDSLCEELDADDGILGEGILLYPQTNLQDPTSEDESPETEEHTATSTPLKRETSDEFTHTNSIPGSFPIDNTLPPFSWKSVTDLPIIDGRRSSTTTTPSAREKYNQAIRSSPHGVRRVSFSRTASATPRLGSTQTGQFEPYPDKNKKSLRDVLNTRLGKDESKSGHLYIFTRRSDKDTHNLYIKIGKAENVTDRLDKWNTQCHYEPHLEYKTALIPNALRAELLVQTELAELRYIEQHCSGCGGKHDEWFKIDLDAAQPVVERWAQWMQECRPYTEEGYLSSHVVQSIFEHRSSQLALTSEKMLMLASAKVTAVAREHSSPESIDRRRTARNVQSLEPVSPSMQKSTLAEPVANLILVSDDEDDSGASQTPWPPPNQKALSYAAVGGGLAEQRTRKRASLVQVTPDQATSTTSAEDKEARMKMETDGGLDEPFVSDAETSDSQNTYHNAESFPDLSPGTIAAVTELVIRPMVQQEILSGSSESALLPITIKNQA